MTIVKSRKRNRGQTYPHLTAALRIYLGLDTENFVTFSSSRFIDGHSSVHSIHVEIEKHRDRYQAGERFSIEAIRNVLNGRPVMASTAFVINNFLSFHAPELVLPEKLPDVSLDLSAFFGMVHHKLRIAAVDISGTFQSYAQATSIPNAEEKVRRGKIRIWYDRKLFQLRIEEDQHRPKINNYHEISLKWNGFCICREDKLFCVMRTERSTAKSTPLFCIFNINFSSLKDGRLVNTMKGVSMGFDPDIAVWPSFPTIFLERTDEDRIIVDFCDRSDIPDHIESEIFPKKHPLKRPRL